MQQTYGWAGTAEAGDARRTVGRQVFAAAFAALAAESESLEGSLQYAVDVCKKTIAISHFAMLSRGSEKPREQCEIRDR